jgi:hypothetical protein
VFSLLDQTVTSVLNVKTAFCEFLKRDHSCLVGIEKATLFASEAVQTPSDVMLLGSIVLVSVDGSLAKGLKLRK